MPGGDRTGPMGMGPMTGRGAGYCAGSGTPGYANPMPERGFGMGRGGAGRGFGGGGRGYRHWFYATGLPGWMRFGAYPGQYVPPDRGSEKQWLESRAQDLAEELELLRKRIAELDRGPAAE